MMNKLDMINKLEFKINWTFIKIGFQGTQFIPVQINKENICEYAISLLEKLESDYDLVAQIICENDDYFFNETLEILVKNEDVDVEIQFRKWRVLIVKNELNNLSDNYFEGLLQLIDLWVSLGLPNDCPIEIQGRNNNISPKQYYTQEQFELAKKQNSDWLEKEIYFIKEKELD